MIFFAPYVKSLMPAGNPVKFTVLFKLVLLLLLALPTPAALASAKEPPKWLSESEINWLKRHPVIKVAPDPFYPPIEFFDKTNKFVGISADYLSEIENLIGVQFTIVKLPNWDEVIEKTKSRELDILSAAAATPSRKEYLDFTVPYLDFPAVIITRQNDIQHTTLSQLKGKRVGVTRGYAVSEFVKTEFPQLNPIEVDSIEEGLRRLSFGKLDAMISISAPALYYIEKNGFINLHVAGQAGYSLKLSFASRNDWPELNNILKKAIEAIPVKTKRRIQSDWIFAEPKPEWRPSQNQILWGTIIVMLSALLMAFSWNRSLKNKVHKKTLELSERLKELELARQQTYNSEQRLRNIFNHAEIGLIIHASDGSLIDMNDVALSMYGVSRDEIKNISVANNLSASDCAFEKIPLYWEKVLKGHPQKFPWRAKRMDNGLEFNVEIALSKLNAQKQDIVLASIIDKQLESEKIDTFRFLTSEAALMITPQLRLLQENIDNIVPQISDNSPDQIRDFINSAHESNNLINDFLDALLVAHGCQKMRIKSVSVLEICQQVKESLAKQLNQQNLDVDIKDLSQDETVLADAFYLKSAIRHLVSLGITHAPKGTTISVVISKPSNLTDIATKDEKASLELTINHQGDAFAPPPADSNTAKNPSQHKGNCTRYLMSEALVEGMGAKLLAESTPNVMTTFKLIFEMDMRDQ